MPLECPWRAPGMPLFHWLEKSSGEQRFCVDYRKLNDVTVNVYQEFPTMDDIFDCMADKQPQHFY